VEFTCWGKKIALLYLINKTKYSNLRLLACLYIISNVITVASANIVNGFDLVEGKFVSGVPCTNCKDGKCYCMAEKGDRVFYD
jgi:hypothetical protein